MTAKAEDQRPFIGNERLLPNAKLTYEQQQTLHKLQAQGKTVSLAGFSGIKLAGMVVIQDAPNRLLSRPWCIAASSGLKDRDVDR